VGGGGGGGLRRENSMHLAMNRQAVQWQLLEPRLLTCARQPRPGRHAKPACLACTAWRERHAGLRSAHLQAVRRGLPGQRPAGPPPGSSGRRAQPPGQRWSLPVLGLWKQCEGGHKGGGGKDCRLQEGRRDRGLPSEGFWMRERRRRHAPAPAAEAAGRLTRRGRGTLPIIGIGSPGRVAALSSPAATAWRPRPR
jgi:hypothetical protein